MNAFFKNNVNFMIEEHIGNSIFNNQHSHKTFEIYYLKKGEVGYFIDNAIYTIKEGSVVIIPPNTLHKTIDTQSSQRRRILIYLENDFIKQFSDNEFAFLNEVSIFHINHSERINYIFTKLLNEYQGEKNSTLLMALMCELLILLQRHKEIKNKIIENNTCSKRITDVVLYINKNYYSNVTLTQTANHFFIHPSYLSRLFKENIGISFSDYLRKYRIKKAIEMMADSNKNITEIAFDVGFNSTNHFCKSFREIIGISPLQYKKQHK